MVNLSLVLSSAAGSIAVETSRNLLPGMMVMRGLEGMGLPDVDVQWASGAGDGASFIGARHLPRDLAVPVKITGADRADLRARLSLLARVLAPAAAPARMSWTADGETWWTDVVRGGGGQFVAGDRASTDLQTYVLTTLHLRAGDPFWTREEASQQIVEPSGTGRGLLGTGRSLSMLRVSSGQAMGAVTVENGGDAPAWPRIIVDGPGTALDLVSPTGQTLHWEGALLVGERRIFDHRTKTLTDPSGANWYSELGPAPVFWSLPPGTSTVTVALTGATSASRVTISWRERRWAMI